MSFTNKYEKSIFECIPKNKFYCKERVNIENRGKNNGLFLGRFIEGEKSVYKDMRGNDTRVIYAKISFGTWLAYELGQIYIVEYNKKA